MDISGTKKYPTVMLEKPFKDGGIKRGRCIIFKTNLGSYNLTELSHVLGINGDEIRIRLRKKGWQHSKFLKIGKRRRPTKIIEKPVIVPSDSIGGRGEYLIKTDQGTFFIKDLSDILYIGPENLRKRIIKHGWEAEGLFAPLKAKDSTYNDLSHIVRGQDCHLSGKSRMYNLKNIKEPTEYENRLFANR